jgi:hypothetical protein
MTGLRQGKLPLRRRAGFTSPAAPCFIIEPAASHRDIQSLSCGFLMLMQINAIPCAAKLNW